MTNIYKSKIGNQNPDAIMYQGADTPSEQQVTQGVKKLNPWKQECWHIKYVDNDTNKYVVYNKDKTLFNCYVKYKIANKSSYPLVYPYVLYDNVYNVDGTFVKQGYQTTDIPLIKEIEDKVPTILVGSNYNRTSVIPRVIFTARNYPDNEYTRKLFQAIREFFSVTPLENDADVSSLFGKANTFGAHWHMGDVQQLHGARKGWVFLIGNGDAVTASHLKSTGVNMIQTFANTGFDDITFVFNKNAVTQLDNAFSATKPSLWGSFNLKVEYADTENPRPYLVMDEVNRFTDVVDFQGFIPLSLIKTFRASKISQEGLNNFFKNSILSWCKDLNGCFADKLRCFHDTVPSACNLSPYEEHEYNTITIGIHEYYTTTRGCIIKTTDNKYKLINSTYDSTIDIQGSLIETFMDSSIKYFHPIIDCRIMCNSYQWNKTFATYRREEGVHPMVDIRLKNLGNCAEYFFDSNGNWDSKNNTKFFSEASIHYLIDNLLDLTQYNPQTKEGSPYTFYHNGIVRNESKIYAPEEWRSKLTEEHLQKARAKNVSIYINNELVN